MAKKTQSHFPENTKIEVVMKKQMTFSEYEKMRIQAKEKGWTISAYQIGFFSIGFKKEIK